MTFLPAFKMCVEAGTYNLVCSYNRYGYFILSKMSKFTQGQEFMIIVDSGRFKNNSRTR